MPAAHTQQRLTQVTPAPSARGEIYSLLYGGGQVCAAHHTNVCKFSRLFRAVSSLVFNKSLSNLAVLLILTRSFQWWRRIFPSWSMLKIDKTMRGSIPTCNHGMSILPTPTPGNMPRVAANTLTSPAANLPILYNFTEQNIPLKRVVVRRFNYLDFCFHVRSNFYKDSNGCA